MYISLGNETLRDSRGPIRNVLAASPQHCDIKTKPYGFRIDHIKVSHGNADTDILSQCEVFTRQDWDPHDRLLAMRPGLCGISAVIVIPEKTDVPYGVGTIYLRFDFDFRICCIIGESRELWTCSQDFMVSRIEYRWSIWTKDELWPYQHLFAEVQPTLEGFWFFRPDIDPLSEQPIKLLPRQPLISEGATPVCCFQGFNVFISLQKEYPGGTAASWVFDMMFKPCPDCTQRSLIDTIV